MALSFYEPSRRSIGEKIQWFIQRTILQDDFLATVYHP